MANENEIVDKIKSFKEKNSPDFKKYMDFYKVKFPDFYNSKLKVFEETEIVKEEKAPQPSVPFDFSAKGEEASKIANQETPKDGVFAEKKVLTDQPIFNINEGKKETSSHTTNGLTLNGTKPANVKPIAKKSSKKIILIITLVLIIIGALVGYFLII